jgi:serine kinase of HPr protein (carbohydrate metabolism regulator)
MSKLILHATCVAYLIKDRWVGVLLTGPSGSGKSDLALRALHEGFQLISDDYTILWPSGGHIYGTAPAPIAGQIEVRGIGIVPSPHRSQTRIGLYVHCQPPPERLPFTETTDILGHSLATVRLDPFERSTVVKLLSYLRHI